MTGNSTGKRGGASRPGPGVEPGPGRESNTGLLQSLGTWVACATDRAKRHPLLLILHFDLISHCLSFALDELVIKARFLFQAARYFGSWIYVPFCLTPSSIGYYTTRGCKTSIRSAAFESTYGFKQQQQYGDDDVDGIFTLDVRHLGNAVHLWLLESTNHRCYKHTSVHALPWKTARPSSAAAWSEMLWWRQA